MMTVGELVRHLQNFKPDLRVLVDGYEDGYEDIEPGCVDVVRAVIDYQEPGWEGPHKNGSAVWDDDGEGPYDRIFVLLISRSEIGEDDRRGTPG